MRGVWRSQLWALGGLGGPWDALGAGHCKKHDIRAECAGSLFIDLGKNLTDLFGHALLPQRGAADLIEVPPGGSTAAPLLF